MNRCFGAVRRNQGPRRVAAMLAVAVGAAPAAGATYVGSAANTNWNDPANWTPGVPAEGEDVTIADVTAQNTLTLNDGPHSVGLFQFGDTGTRALSGTSPAFAVAAPAANALTINGGLTALSGVVTTTGVSLNLSAPVVIQGDQTWSIGGSAGTPTSDQGVAFPSSANAITFNGKITKTGTGQLLFVGRTFGDGSIDVAAGSVKLNAGSTALLTVNGTGTITVGTGTAGTGATLIVAKNSGTLSMTKAVAVNAGTLSVGGNNATGTPGTFNIASPVSWAGTNTLNQTSDTANVVANFSGPWTGSGIIATTVAGAAGATGRYVVISGDNIGLSARFQNAVTLAVGSDTALGTGVYRSNGGSTLRAADMTPRVVPNVFDVASSTTFGSAAADGTPTSGNLTFTATGSGTSDAGTVTGIATGNAAKTLTVLNARTTISGTVTGGPSVNPITKAGTGLLELSGLNTYNRPTTIAAGTLQVTGSGRLGAANNAQPVTVADAGLLDLRSAGLSDAASLSITSTDTTAEVNVGDGVNDTVNMLFINGVAMTPGTYGSTASAATNASFGFTGLASPNEVFSGTGVLTVLTIPEPASVGLLGTAAGLLAACRRRRAGKA